MCVFVLLVDAIRGCWRMHEVGSKAGQAAASWKQVCPTKSAAATCYITVIVLIGASLSEPHTSVAPYVCMFACLDRPLTVSHFQLLYILCILHHVLIQKGLKRTVSQATMANGINRLPCGYLYHSSHWIGESVSGLYHCGRHRGVRLFMFMSSTPTLHWTQISSGCSDGGYRQCRPVKLATCRVLSSIHAISIWLAACAGPACVQHAWARPDSHVLCCTCVYAILCVWYPVAWGSVTFWWQSCLCNGSTFYMSTRSGSPYNVMHSSSNKYL